MQPSIGGRPPTPRTVLLAEVAQATQRLADAGVPSPRFDAEELAAYVHGVKRGELHNVQDADFDARYWEAVARRENREPLQHITGRAFFRYLELQVGPGVFVPRPETESVVGWAIDAVRAMDVAEPLVVDLCTGSGAIALALAQEVPRSRVHAVELDEGALRWTRKNVEGSRVGAAPGRRPHRAAGTQRPGRPGGQQPAVHPAHRVGVRGPRGPRPRSRTRAVLRRGRPRHHPRHRAGRHRLLRPGGVVVVEHADTQGGQVPWIFNEETGWTDAADHRDLNNRPRFTTARKALP